MRKITAWPFLTAVTGLLLVCLIQEAVPIAPFYGNILIGSQFKKNSLPVFRMHAAIYGSSVVRDTELISITDAGQQVCLIYLLRRVGIFIWDYIHSESRPRIEHCCVLPREQDSSQLGVRSRSLTSIFGPIVDCRNVLSDIQLCPEINVVRPIAAEIDSRHSVVGPNPLIINNYWSGDERNLFIWPDPWPLTLAHSISGSPVVDRAEDYKEERESSVHNDTNKRSFGYSVISVFLSFILFALGFVLINKTWWRVYFDSSMDSNVAIARISLATFLIWMGIVLFLVLLIHGF